MWLLAILVALVLVGWGILKLLNLIASKDPQDFSRLSKVSVRGSAGTLRVALADTEDSLGKGLSGHEKLRDVHGVLLVPPGKCSSLTMLGMQFPLDIVWLDESDRIVHVLYTARPGIWPLMIRSPKSARKVLEVPSGKLKKLGELGVGTQLTITS